MNTREATVNHILSILATGAFCFILALCAHQRAEAAASGSHEPALPLSDMQIRITSQGKAATFQLYDTAAARKLYGQLPLTLDLTNFRDAQWMFYPPRKLNTSGAPLAKNVRPGTLCYYAPWADVVMFYGSFGSAPGLYELGRAVQGAEHIRSLSGSIRIEAGGSATPRRDADQ